jgi:MoxR-like ATPase
MDVDKRPADILGYYDIDGENPTLLFRPGLIFANIVLIDEFHRARPEAKGDLLQAIAKREVSIDLKTYAIDDPFFIIANQNPLEQEGTYHLIKAELDRSMTKLHLDYLSRSDEVAILQRVANPTYLPSHIQSLPENLLAPSSPSLRPWRHLRRHYRRPGVTSKASEHCRAKTPPNFTNCHICPLCTPSLILRHFLLYLYLSVSDAISAQIDLAGASHGQPIQRQPAHHPG